MTTKKFLKSNNLTDLSNIYFIEHKIFSNQKTTVLELINNQKLENCKKYQSK